MLLTVTIPAADAGLLTIDELRAATGQTDGARDADLDVLGQRVAGSIADACRVVAAGATPVTLRLETVAQTERNVCDEPEIYLARRPVTEILSVTADDAVLDPSEYEVDARTGLLYRICADLRVCWFARKLVIAYSAGWDTVPNGLKLAAAKLAGALWAEGTRDPNLKRTRIEGVSEREYWVPPTTDPLLSAEITDLLAPYMEARL